ncbi:pilus assembly protein [Mycolicibacterium sp.]|uniref:pilus assembly protein n=1 Tax=Mycolicibacterium sp. TaxID=2320850 RepID=UPI0037C72E39
MTSAPIWRQPKRLCAITVSGAMLLQAVFPAYAAVSQNPATYIVQPDPNVMFTLDDSGSMNSDVIPDLASNLAGFPSGDSRTFFNDSTAGTKFPMMWVKTNSGTGVDTSTSSRFLRPLYYDGTGESNAAKVTRFLRSSASNPLYYDHRTTYLPWPDPSNDSQRLADADPDAVNIDQDDARVTTRRLNIRNRVDIGSESFWPATYFRYTGTSPYPLGQPFASVNVASNFVKVEIRSTVTSYPRHMVNGVVDDGRTDCGTATSCTYQQELQNFANWLQYYHSRMLMTKGGVAMAFASQQENLRAGFGTLNSSGTVVRGVRQFRSTDRTAFYTSMYGRAASGSTPLRRALDQVGRYFQTTDVNNPWAHSPGSTRDPEYSCRRSFHILSTDGYWNGDDGSIPDPRDRDNFTGAFTPPPAGSTAGYAFTDNPPSGASEEARRFTINPFRDAAGSNAGELSDIAAYYWLTDLRGGTRALANNVPPSRRDPAFWQHLTTFTVGLGISGSGQVRRNSDGSTVVPANEPSTSPFHAHRGKTWLQDDTMRDLVVAHKVALNWPTVSAESAATGDDLIRAAMVGRGRYFSAINPNMLAIGLASALAEATDAPLSQSNLAVWSQELRDDNRVYQATFSPASWYGRLYAFQQGMSGSVNPTPSTALWEASNRMPPPGSRTIYTWNAEGTTPGARLFTWENLNSTQRGHLGNDENVLHYLRGDGSREIQNGGEFRDRFRYVVEGGGATPGVLGDIVNSSPVKGMLDGAGYQRLPVGTPGRDQYAEFRSGTGLSNMINTVFVGANDGMLHAFNTTNGVERFAYVPNSVYNVPRSLNGGNEQKLRMLTQPTYQHRYTVDGSPQLADAFVGPDAATARWRTMLTATTGAGARSLFAMDVTNPAPDGSTTGFSTANIRWEFSEANAAHGADMGHVLSYAHVARMANGRWGVIFGNGYDSASGRAALFVLDLWTGEVIRKIPVGPTPTATQRKNGLSQPNFITRDRVVQYVYAGDLYGNLWKFDLTSADPNDWRPSFGSSPAYEPLYNTGDNRPITVMPAIGLRHDHGGAMLIFGTGQFFDTGDTSTSSTENINLRARQAIYGIWDKPGETSGFSGTTQLREQAIDTSITASTQGLRGTTTALVSYPTQRGWYMQLTSGGERVNVNPQLPNPNDRLSPVFVVANLPAAAVPCTGGGSGVVVGLDPYHGRSPERAAFDADGSGIIDSADNGYNVLSVDRGILTQPVFQSGRSRPGGPEANPQPRVEADVFPDGRTGAKDGGREDSSDPNAGLGGCGNSTSDNLIVGVSDTSIVNARVRLAGSGACPGRISWRQIQ